MKDGEYEDQSDCRHPYPLCIGAGIILFKNDNQSTQDTLGEAQPLNEEIVRKIERSLLGNDQSQSELALAPVLRAGKWPLANNGEEFVIDTRSLHHSGDYGQVIARVGNMHVIIHLENTNGQWFVFAIEKGN